MKSVQLRVSMLENYLFHYPYKAMLITLQLWSEVTMPRPKNNCLYFKQVVLDQLQEQAEELTT